MRHALLATLLLALAGCAGSTAVAHSPTTPHGYVASMGSIPSDAGRVDRNYATAPSYGTNDMGATPSYTLADLR